MHNVLVVVQSDFAGNPAGYAAELIGAASQVGRPVVLFFGELDKADALFAQGAADVLVYAPDASLLGAETGAVVAAFELVNPVAVLFSHSIDGCDIAARFAVRQKLALACDAVGLGIDELGVTAEHSVYGGDYNTVSAATFGALVVTLRQGSVATRVAETTGTAKVLEVGESGTPVVKIIGFTPEINKSSRPELRGADKIVSGGWALGSADEFERIVGGLADALGAAVGASRMAVDSGFIQYSHQVGQTGVTVSPNLYIALGISGAVQHLAGMQTAKTIIAVNKDETAPIFEIADFGVVGDIFVVVPQLIAELEAKKAV